MYTISNELFMKLWLDVKKKKNMKTKSTSRRRGKWSVTKAVSTICTSILLSLSVVKMLFGVFRSFSSAPPPSLYDFSHEQYQKRKGDKRKQVKNAKGR